MDDRSFATQRECLRAIRRDEPEHDVEPTGDYGQIGSVEHYPDYVFRFESIPMVQNGSIYTACFRQEPPTS